MADEFFLETEQYVKHAKTVGDISEKLKRAELRLASLLNAEGKCWGEDETGQSFEQPYAEKAGTAFFNSNIGVDHLSYLGAAMSWAADQTAGQEHHTENSFSWKG
ncbi:hypothetical protein AAFP30_22195 [Gordonia sp. CPCC 205515]|uniref:hypothetical protein n=1 Tax=Gordonia sp. CPCC 205515 TaxID=3140791 RepID=UPI003AF3E156